MSAQSISDSLSIGLTRLQRPIVRSVGSVNSIRTSGTTGMYGCRENLTGSLQKVGCLVVKWEILSAIRELVRSAFRGEQVRRVP